MTRGLAAAALGLALLGSRAGAEAGAAPASFDYLTIRAHENSASGGHAAIRFGSDVFDFQHVDGWLAVRREDARRFQHDYRTLQNRSIAVSRIETTPETVALLRETFERRLLAQSRQLALLGEMEGDVALLDALAAGEAARVPVRGAGFFADAPAEGTDPPAALAELRAAIGARHGADWLDGRREAVLRTLRDVAPSPQDSAALRADPLRYPVARESLSRRTGRALAALRACEAILRPRPLREGVRAGEGLAPDSWLTLDAALRARLSEARAGLLDAAVALAASQRPDWGEALLLASARLVALDESLATGRLVMLDAFPSDAQTLRVGATRRALLPTLLGEARRDFVEAQQCLFAHPGYREATWNELEAAISRIAELRAAEGGARGLRVATGAMLPEGLAPVPVAPHLSASREETARAALAAREGLRAYESALEEQYRYDLLRRNCVSELFRTIEAGLASADGAPAASDRDAVRDFVRSESRRRLGGYVDPVAAANFIPFVSSRNVRAAWQVTEEIHLPSAREHAADGGGLAAALRESNVLTSSFYEPAEDAAFFVFFTDGKWPLRPLFGAANLVAATARSGLGLLELPFDRGRGLRAGVEGALWSLPELLFVNIRKGTSEYLPPEQRPPAR